MISGCIPRVETLMRNCYPVSAVTLFCSLSYLLFLLMGSDRLCRFALSSARLRASRSSLMVPFLRWPVWEMDLLLVDGSHLLWRTWRWNIVDLGGVDAEQLAAFKFKSDESKNTYLHWMQPFVSATYDSGLTSYYLFSHGRKGILTYIAFTISEGLKLAQDACQLSASMSSNTCKVDESFFRPDKQPLSYWSVFAFYPKNLKTMHIRWLPSFKQQCFASQGFARWTLI